MSFLHGVQTIRSIAGVAAAIVAASAIIGLVGTAPIQTVATEDKRLNVPVLCRTDTDDAKYFGADTAGYSIPEALKLIRAQDPFAQVVVVNVFDPVSMVTATVPDPTLVTATHIVGTVSVGGVRSGMQALLNAKTVVGVAPRVLIAPRFSTAATVVTALAALIPKLKAKALVDAPAATTVAAAVTARGEGGSLNLNVANADIDLLHTWWKMPVGESFRVVPYSPIIAGIISWVHANAPEAYAASYSNRLIQGVTGPEQVIYTSHTDPGADNQTLNAQGLVSYLAEGSALYTWGNRNSLFPAETGIGTFSNVMMAAAIVEESLATWIRPHLDKGINKPRLDDIVAGGNEFFRGERVKGRLVDGKFYLDPTANSTSELQNGAAGWVYEFVPPPPLEKATFKSVINTDLLAAATA